MRPCEKCGGTGLIQGFGTFAGSTARFEYDHLCPACEGTGKVKDAKEDVS